MTGDPSQMGIVHMLTGSGPVVLAVLYGLLLASVVSWAIIFFKTRQIWQAQKSSDDFLGMFWETRNLADVSRKAEAAEPSPISSVFRAGYDELLRLHNLRKSEDGAGREFGGTVTVERAMRRAASHERTELEKLLTFLATTASSAPFVGLFGTVWGIMNAFLGLSAGGASSIQAVAPGISEALIATAVGLAAAIPALIAYNHLARRTRVMGGEMDNFISDFLNIAERHFLG